MVARTEGNPGTLLSGLRAQLRAVGPDLRLSALGTLDTRLADSLLLAKVSAGMLGLVSVLAVLLASVGIYAVVSFSVARRSQEIGIRIALGAERSQVIGFVMREMLATVLIGLAVGAGLALPAASALAPALYEVTTFPAAILGLGALLPAAVATLATYIPARRAADANPVATLRAR